MKNKGKIYTVILIGLMMASFFVTASLARPPVDGKPPNINVVNPKNLDGVKGTVTFRVNAWDDQSGISEVSCGIRGTGINFVDYSAPYKFSFNSLQVADGAYIVDFAAVDNGYPEENVATRKITIVVCNQDQKKPTITIQKPSNNAIVNLKINIEGRVSDNLGVKRVNCYIDGKLYGYMTAKYVFKNKGYGWTWDTRGYANKKHIITCEAIDYAGKKSAHSISVTVNNDITPPSVKIMHPLNGQEFEPGEITICQIRATDNIGVVYLRVLLDFRIIALFTHRPAKEMIYYFTFRLPEREGYYPLSCVTKDQAGNSVGKGIMISVVSDWF